MTDDEIQFFAEYVIVTLQTDYDSIQDGRRAIGKLIMEADRIRVLTGGVPAELHKRTLLEVLANARSNEVVNLPKKNKASKS